jgi:hypothetical protein
MITKKQTEEVKQLYFEAFIRFRNGLKRYEF